jgi:asparagine synthase (glutamine-hydrolysing)
MANSVEARPPYLDHKLVEYVYNLPQRYKIDGLFYNKRNKNLKCILKALAKRYLPDEISKRPKFSSALFSEIYDLVPDKIRSYLFDQPFFIGRIYPRKNVEKLLQIYKFNKTALFVLNKLFFLEVWAKQYLSADRVPQTQSGMGKFKINNNVNI